MPLNVSYGQHGFNSPPMINTGGPQSPGMSSGGIPSPGSVHSSRSGIQVCWSVHFTLCGEIAQMVKQRTIEWEVLGL